MLNDRVDRLRHLIAEHKVVFLVGAGVSMQVTGNEPASSWSGFMERGIALAARRTANIENTSDWVTSVRREMTSDDPDRRLAAEDLVLERLGGPASPGVAQWLLDSVGSLSPKDPAPIEALAALGAPLLTLNYDNLLEALTGRPTVTWQQPVEMRNVAQGQAEGIVHLHGHWSDPGSVVLGTRGYERIASEKAAQELVNAVSYANSLVLVGFGAPLDSLHFKPLRSWLANSPGDHHMRLVTAGERARFTSPAFVEEQNHLDLIEYGNGFDDLAPFLRSLMAPPPSASPKGTLRPHAADDDGASGGWRKLLGRASFPAVFLFVLALFQAIDRSGITTLVCATGVGIAALMLAEIFVRARRTHSRTIGLGLSSIVAVVSAVIALGGSASSGQEGAHTDRNPALSTTVPSGTQPTAPSASTGTTNTATTREPSAAPTPATGPRTRRVDWGGGPDTANVLGLLMTIGKIDLGNDGEDLVRRVTLRIGDRRCPSRDAWRDVRTGDRLEIITGRYRYRVLIYDISFGGVPAMISTITRTPRSPLPRPACRRS